MVGVIPLLARLESRTLHVAQSRKAIITIGGTMLLFFLILHTVLLLNLLGRAATVVTYWPIAAGVVLIVVGNYLGKMRSNDFVGIRTPWTMASELSWNKTHRLGGKLLFLLGILLMAGTLFIAGDTGELWVTGLLGAALVWAVILVVYSYLVWKGDPDAPGRGREQGSVE